MPSSNQSRPQIVAAQSRAFEGNKHHPRIVSAASRHGIRIRVRLVSDHGHHAGARTVCVVRVVSTAVKKTERLLLVVKWLWLSVNSYV